jgi:hypothetical protein
MAEEHSENEKWEMRKQEWKNGGDKVIGRLIIISREMGRWGEKVIG